MTDVFVVDIVVVIVVVIIVVIVVVVVMVIVLSDEKSMQQTLPCFDFHCKAFFKTAGPRKIEDLMKSCKKILPK